MANLRLAETMKILNRVRARTNEVAVAYSGGKDSLAVVEMATRMFDRVELFLLYIVPGLDCVQQDIDFAKRQWGLEVHQYPHYALTDLIQRGVYCPNTFKHDDLREWNFADACAMVRERHKVPVVLTGMKRNDSQRRREMLKMQEDAGTTAWEHPLIGWNRYDVLSYLRVSGVPYDADKAVKHGLHTESLLWLYDNWPQDFEKLLRYFPYAGAVPARRRIYGTELAKRVKP